MGVKNEGKRGLDLKLADIAEKIDAQIHGDGLCEISGVASIHEAETGDITFLSEKKYLSAAQKSRASAIITSGILDLQKSQLIVPNPYLSFSRVIEIFHPPQVYSGIIHPSAVIENDVKLGHSVTIFPNVFIGRGCRIGDRAVIEAGVFLGHETQIGRETIIHANVSIYHNCQIGAHVIIHSGTVIGADGFGFIQTGDGKHHKIPQIGRVVIEDDVEIGANVCIDRATLGQTTIKRGTKFDNLVQVGHNVEIGENSLLVALVGISGSTKLGRNVILAGQVGVADHITIGDKSMVMGQSGITHDLPANSVVAGTPSMPFKEWKRVSLSLAKLPELIRKVRELEKRITKKEEYGQADRSNSSDS